MLSVSVKQIKQLSGNTNINVYNLQSRFSDINSGNYIISLQFAPSFVMKAIRNI
jgi:hypothetical protein